ncbi:uncharacterized protein [Nicotiana tomentosiformis]|uniref:uncharacterized protein n=1 Tax=Nicotiana tomentosiformis TaxID=4098 RepID=UPI00388C536E
MSNSQSAHLNVDAESGHHGENNNIVPSNEVPPVDPNRVPVADPIYANSPVAIDANLLIDPENNVRGRARSIARGTHDGEGDRINLRMIIEMLQAQQAAIAQLQNQSRAPSRVKPKPSQENTRRNEQVSKRLGEVEHGTNPEIIKMLEELTKRVESGETKVKANDKKVETYNSRVDQIPGAPPVLKGLDSKKFVQNPFPPSAELKPILNKFCMPKILKYNRTMDPNKHVTSYTCAIRGNNLEDDEIESVLLKRFGETMSKGAMIWYHNLPPNPIDSFAMLADVFVKANAGAIKVETRKSDLFKLKQRDNEMLREFVSRFQMERMDLPPVADDWAVQAFIQELNPQSSLASQQLK